VPANPGSLVFDYANLSWQTHTAQVIWGDNTQSAGTVTEANGQGSVAASHVYADNGSYTIQLVVTDDANASGSLSASATVANVAPSSPVLSLSAGGTAATAVSEGSPTTLSGTFTDPGLLDSQTVVVSWGDTPVTVLNVAPGNVTLTASPGTINEGDSTTLSGSFTDPGTLDTHTVAISWGDGSPNTTLSLAAGVLTFGGVSHQYLDNLPGNAPYAVSATVTDKDGAAGTGSTAVTVLNVAPASLALALSAGATAATALAEGGSTTLSGTFTDPGTLDTHTVARHQPLNFQVATFTTPGFNNPAGGTQKTFTASVNWGDGTAPTAGTVTVTPGSPGVPTRGTVSGAHTYAQAADYTVTVTVTDDDAGAGSATFRMHVLAHGATKFYVVDQPAHSDFTYDAYTNPVGVLPLDHPMNSRARGVASNASGNTQWVIDADKNVYVYNPDGSLRGSWAAGGLNQPQDIATDGTDIWIVDNASNQVFHYAGAASRLSGSQDPDAASFALAAADTSPSGIVTNGSTFWVTDDHAQNGTVFVYSGRAPCWAAGCWTRPTAPPAASP
jgi:hypothetical protein